MISYSQIKAAEKRIRKYIKRTPLEHSIFLSKKCRGEVYLKPENMQVTSSFKARGALNKVLLLSPARRKNIITASAGNHAIAVAYACSIVGVVPRIVVPKNVAQVKLEAIKHYHPKLIIRGRDYDEAEAYAISLAKKNNYTYISPYNDEKVIAGQGTIGLEVMREAPDTDMIICPVGGGGLAAGVAIAAKHNKRVFVVGAQSDASPAMAVSLHAGTIMHIPLKDSIADGLHGNIVQKSITFPLVKKHLDGMLLVTEREIKEAIKLMLKHHHIALEGSAAVVVAAVLKHTKLFSRKRIVLVLTGGNIDLSVLRKAL